MPGWRSRPSLPPAILPASERAATLRARSDEALTSESTRVPGAVQHEVVRCRPGTVRVRGGPGSAAHRFTSFRAAPHPGHAAWPAVTPASLNTAAAVRDRCAMVGRWVADGRSPHFSLDESRLDAVAAYVADVTREAHPDLQIPYHSRWRHFSAGGVDRWTDLAARIDGDAIERARIAADLATVSVLLDAGAGDQWRYRERATGLSFARSEGLAVASFDMFRAGSFSSDPDRPWRVDAEALANIHATTLAGHFQADAGNPLVGLEQRGALLRRLGTTLADRADLFGRAPARPGNLIDYFHTIAREQRICASRLLATLLDGLASIWPSALMVDGYPVGDAGRHPAVRTGDETHQIVPFHKLSQWLAYSAIDPRVQHDVASELIVEWRALTVVLLDTLLDLVRAKLGLDASFALPQLLQGGTWSAGRKIARARRPPDGPPPIVVAADGTVF